jgi:type IV pilus assembly protein PilO
MKLEDFNQIDPKNMGSLPLPVKAVILGAIFLVLVGAGYWFVWQPAMEELDQAGAKEEKLRGVFMTKKKEAVNLPIYKQQMVEIERTFGTLLRQLPDKSQMDGLLTDINQAGLEVGLEFELFKPGQERRAEFYADKPISLKVIGGYYELGAFAQNIARLSRIVRLEDMSIAPVGKDGKLAVSAIARTFRYLDSSEMASQAKPDKKSKKKKSKK